MFIAVAKDLKLFPRPDQLYCKTMKGQTTIPWGLPSNSYVINSRTCHAEAPDLTNNKMFSPSRGPPQYKMPLQYRPRKGEQARKPGNAWNLAADGFRAHHSVKNDRCPTREWWIVTENLTEPQLPDNES